MRRLMLMALAAAMLATTPALAAAAAAQTFPLYDAPPPGWTPPALHTEIIEDWAADHHRMIRNVVVPTVTAFLPDPVRATGAGVVIFPGGGFLAVSIDQEGTEAARWLAAHGVAAFVVKYRVRETPPDPKAFWPLWTQTFGPGFDPMAPLPGEVEAIADGRAALALVRAKAPAFGVDPARLGVLGFSAGGIMAIDAATGPAPRPAFVADLYAPVRPTVTVPKDAPPLFAAIAEDDPLFGSVATSPYEAWRKAGRPAELHVYAGGGHGFGMRRQGTTSDGWMEGFYGWLEAEGALGRGR